MEDQQKIIDLEAFNKIIALTNYYEAMKKTWSETNIVMTQVIYNAPEIMKGEYGQTMLRSMKAWSHFMEKCYHDFKYLEARVEENLKSRE